MNDNRFSGLLGICRKANKMSIGHDASKISVKNGEACLVILASDAADRLKEEFSSLCSEDGAKAEVIETDIPQRFLALKIGTKAAVLTVNDIGFAQKLKQYWEDNL